MIRLATVFSGIGAIEHAMQRMALDNRVVFACDNGDIEILTKNIDNNVDEIESELKELTNTISDIQFNEEVEDLYKDQLSKMLTKATIELSEIQDKLLHNRVYGKTYITSVLNKIIAMPAIKPLRKKEYAKFCDEITRGSELETKFREFQIILELVNDFKKDNRLEIIDTENRLEGLFDSEELKSTDGIDWKSVLDDMVALYKHIEVENGKPTIRRVQDLSQRTSQLYEKINYLKIQKQLKNMGKDWLARKEYVDSLYAGMESRNKVKKSYMANYSLSNDDYHWNVAFLDGEQYHDKVDLFVGGSPCQSFSLVGKQRGLEDTRGTLFYEYARLIKEIKPKVFIYENVKAVTSHDGGKTWEKMQQVFKELGYNFSYALLNAKNYGIPQNRERLFVVGFRKDLTLATPFEFPETIPLERKMKDFLINNAPGGYFLPKKGVAFVTMEKNLTKKYTQIDGDIQLCQKKNQQFNWHGDFVFQSEDEAKANNIPDLEKYYLSEKVVKYVLATGTKGFYSKPKTDLDIARPLLTTMHKMHRAGVDNYVTTDGRLRKLTPRECLRLMGFSDTFKIEVSDTSMYQQAGNSIVVDVLIHIMDQIIKSYPELNM